MSLTFTPSNIITTPKTSTSTGGPTYRIITVFEKTIELDELSIPGSNTRGNYKVEDAISLEYPLIKINDYIFNRDEIRSMTIDCTEFIPKIQLDVAMLNQLFLAKEMPKDGDIISIAIRNRSDVLKIIRNDYVITGVHVLPNYTSTKSPVIMTFYGELFIPGLKSHIYDMSYEGTSFYALQDFAKKFGLGFASNEEDTDDKQIWLKANVAGDIYVNTVTQRAYKDVDSFYQCWIDLYYNLNFVNVNKQLISSEISVDVTALLSNVDKNFVYGANAAEEKTSKTVKVFSNFQNFRTTPFYITSWRPTNMSSAITFQIGTKMVCEMFEHNINLYADASSKKYWQVPVNPTYDVNKTNQYILLRGRPNFVNDSSTTDLKRANYPYVNLYERDPWLGVQYTISNPDADNLQWDGNHHRNYQVARVKNLVNNMELDKLNVKIEVTGNNFSVARGDKLPIALIRTDAIDNLRVDVNSGYQDSLDLFYSGWYLVKGFTLNFSSDHEDSILSNFTQEFILTRREWPTPVSVDPVKPVTTT
jgi:hypothetical protein